MTEEKKVWGIHTLDNELFMRENVIAIGWREMGDLSELNDRAEFKERYARVYPHATKQGVANSAGMLYRFAREVQVGDSILPKQIERSISVLWKGSISIAPVRRLMSSREK